jgi:hypothetical protein
VSYIKKLTRNRELHGYSTLQMGETGIEEEEEEKEEEEEDCDLR